MAAGLATKTNGQAALWLNGQPAWHRLGKVWTEADGEVTLERVIEESGLGFEVEKRPLFFGAAEDSVMGMGRTKRGHTFATVRTDTEEQLGTVGNVYEPFQNLNAFRFLEYWTGQGASRYESAGALAVGSRVFVTMSLGEDIVLDPQGVADAIKKYALVTNAHDGTGKVTAATTPTRVVCANTLRYGLDRAATKIEVRHTSGGIDRLKETGAQTLGLARKYYDEFEADAVALLGARMTKQQFHKFLEQVAFPTSATMGKQEAANRVADRERAMAIWETAKTMDGVRGTRWGALQALTEDLDHRKAVSVPKSLGLDTAAPKTLREDIARGARVVNGTDDDRKTRLHKALLTWGR